MTDTNAPRSVTEPAFGQSASTGGLGVWVVVNLPFGRIFGSGQNHSTVELDSFSKRGLNKPGVIIRMDDGNEYLIGHINDVRGVCEDCSEFAKDAIVNAYKIVWMPNVAVSGTAKRSFDGSA